MNKQISNKEYDYSRFVVRKEVRSTWYGTLSEDSFDEYSRACDIIRLRGFGDEIGKDYTQNHYFGFWTIFYCIFFSLSVLSIYIGQLEIYNLVMPGILLLWCASRTNKSYHREHIIRICKLAEKIEKAHLEKCEEDDLKRAHDTLKTVLE